MKRIFQKVERRAEWQKLSGKGSPFFAQEWEQELSKRFPYLSFEHFVYRGNVAVRVARIGSRVTTAPFSDGGDVVLISGEPLQLKTFHTDCTDFFGNDYYLRVHSYFCPVDGASNFPVNITDAEVALGKVEELSHSFRKTVRHILSKSDTGNVEQCTESRDVRTVYNIYLKKMREALSVALPYSFFEYMFTNKDVDLLLWKMDGIPHAFALFFRSALTSHYFLAGSDTVGSRYDAPHRLVWSVMERYSKNGLERMFLGTTRTESSLNVFKRGWRGTEHAVYTLSSQRTHDTFRVSPARKLWRFLPLSFLPRMSQMVGKYFF